MILRVWGNIILVIPSLSVKHVADSVMDWGNASQQRGLAWTGPQKEEEAAAAM